MNAAEGPATFYLLEPRTRSAKDWIRENIGEDAIFQGAAVAVEWRYLGGILRALQESGFTIEGEIEREQKPRFEIRGYPRLLLEIPEGERVKTPFAAVKAYLGSEDYAPESYHLTVTDRETGLERDFQIIDGIVCPGIWTESGWDFPVPELRFEVRSVDLRTGPCSSDFPTIEQALDFALPRLSGPFASGFSDVEVYKITLQGGLILDSERVEIEGVNL